MSAVVLNCVEPRSPTVGVDELWWVVVDVRAVLEVEVAEEIEELVDAPAVDELEELLEVVEEPDELLDSAVDDEPDEVVDDEVTVVVGDVDVVV
jgi:hypothetical protein